MNMVIWHVKAEWDAEQRRIVSSRKPCVVEGSSESMLDLGEHGHVGKWEMNQLRVRDIDSFDFYVENPAHIKPMLLKGAERLKNLCEVNITHFSKRLAYIRDLKERIQEEEETK